MHSGCPGVFLVPLTLRLLDARSNASQEIIGCHENLVIAVVAMDLQRGKVSKYLVWGGVLTDPILILNDL